LRLRVHPRDTFPGRRILDVALPVPDEAADIELIMNDAGPAGPMSADRGVRPFVSEGSADAIHIQIHRDRARTFAAGERLEDATHHVGFHLVDGSFTPHRLAVRPEGLDDIIAVAKAAAGFALLHPTPQAASRFLR